MLRAPKAGQIGVVTILSYRIPDDGSVTKLHLKMNSCRFSEES
jgi:hypothetical protein